LRAYQSDKDLKIIIHDKNMGAGYSVREGIMLAQGEYFYAPGADLEYEMSDVYKMVEKLEAGNLDGVFGSRLLGRKDASFFKLIKERPYWLGTIIATALINLFYGRKFTDVIATKLIKTEVLRNLGCRITNEASEFELVSRICKQGLKIEEVPVSYKARTHKEGKTIKAIHMLPALWAILKIKFWLRKDAT
jgi:glycosyltransferase involved in cell wall biosynthesis